MKLVIVACCITSLNGSINDYYEMKKHSNIFFPLVFYYNYTINLTSLKHVEIDIYGLYIESTSSNTKLKTEGIYSLSVNQLLTSDWPLHVFFTLYVFYWHQIKYYEDLSFLSFIFHHFLVCHRLCVN